VKKKNPMLKTTAYNSSLAKYFSRYFAKLPWSLYAIEKIHHTFFLHLKNTLWVTARFFIINALVKILMFSTKADGH
jgi:hypothetical protein